MQLHHQLGWTLKRMKEVLDFAVSEAAHRRVRPVGAPSGQVVLVLQSPQGAPQSLGDRLLEDSGTGESALNQAVLEAYNEEFPIDADEVRLPSSDTETIGAVSDLSVHAPTVVPEPVAPVEEFTISPAIRGALRCLDIVDVSNIFRRSFPAVLAVQLRGWLCTRLLWRRASR